MHSFPPGLEAPAVAAALLDCQAPPPLFFAKVARAVNGPLSDIYLSEFFKRAAAALAGDKDGKESFRLLREWVSDGGTIGDAIGSLLKDNVGLSYVLFDHCYDALKEAIKARDMECAMNELRIAHALAVEPHISLYVYDILYQTLYDTSLQEALIIHDQLLDAWGRMPKGELDSTSPSKLYEYENSVRRSFRDRIRHAFATERFYGSTFITLSQLNFKTAILKQEVRRCIAANRLRSLGGTIVGAVQRIFRLKTRAR